ncbi:MAG: hypothetical protein ABSH28_09050 [Acidobacteriota bacterium]|jgi:hypothetical protein
MSLFSKIMERITGQWEPAPVSKRELRRAERAERRVLNEEQEKVAAQREAEAERRRRTWAPPPADLFEAGSDEYTGGPAIQWLRNGEPWQATSFEDWIQGRRH